jgi:hypothetical protein
VTHVKLANRRCGLRPVSDSIDHEAARTADTFTAIVIEGDRLFTLRNQFFIKHIQHFEKRHMRIYFRVLVLDHAANVIRIFLPPNVESEFHYL